MTGGLRVRPARHGDASPLSERALRSKAVWGYDDDFLNACRDELSVSPTDIDTNCIRVGEDVGSVVEFYRLSIKAGVGSVDLFFVDPDSVRHGYGRLLWTGDLARQAQERGLTDLTVDSDPHAEAFYRAMGCRSAGDAASGSIPGRRLSRLRFDLEAPATA